MSVQIIFRAYQFKKLLENDKFLLDCIFNIESISNEYRIKAKTKKEEK
jgi:hypothetical protein